MDNNENCCVNCKKKSALQKDLNVIKNELIDKFDKLIYKFIERIIFDDGRMDSLNSLRHIIFLNSLLDEYFEDEVYYSLDMCVSSLLKANSLCEKADESYKILFKKYRESEEYQAVKEYFQEQK